MIQPKTGKLQCKKVVGNFSLNSLYSKNNEKLTFYFRNEKFRPTEDGLFGYLCPSLKDLFRRMAAQVQHFPN